MRLMFCITIHTYTYTVIVLLHTYAYTYILLVIFHSRGSSQTVSWSDGCLERGKERERERGGGGEKGRKNTINYICNMISILNIVNNTAKMRQLIT